MRLLHTPISALVIIGIFFFSNCTACAFVGVEEAERNKLRPSIVSIHDTVSNTRGTGFIIEIEDTRYIMSAKHIFLNRLNGPSIEDVIESFISNEPIEMEGDIDVYDFYGNRSVSYIVSYTDEFDIMNNRGEDWIILTCPKELKGLPALILSKDLPYFGEQVYWIGYPDTNEGAVVSQCNIGDVIRDGTQVRLDGMIGPGASGSPLYDPDKGVVGIITMGTNPTHYGIALNIPFMYEEILSELDKDLAVL